MKKGGSGVAALILEAYWTYPYPLRREQRKLKYLWIGVQTVYVESFWLPNSSIKANCVQVADLQIALELGYTTAPGSQS